MLSLSQRSRGLQLLCPARAGHLYVILPALHMDLRSQEVLEYIVWKANSTRLYLCISREVLTYAGVKLSG